MLNFERTNQLEKRKWFFEKKPNYSEIFYEDIAIKNYISGILYKEGFYLINNLILRKNNDLIIVLHIVGDFIKESNSRGLGQSKIAYKDKNKNLDLSKIISKNLTKHLIWNRLSLVSKDIKFKGFGKNQFGGKSNHTIIRGNRSKRNILFSFNTSKLREIKKFLYLNNDLNVSGLSIASKQEPYIYKNYKYKQEKEGKQDKQWKQEVEKGSNSQKSNLQLFHYFTNQDLLSKYNLFKNKFIYKNIKLFIFNDDFDQKWFKKLNVTMSHNDGLDAHFK
jgi:hypothetical protein